jgi:hypothetical protein
MTLTINSKVIDNDVKGNNGRGTVYLLQILEGSQVLAKCTYGLLEEIKGSFNREKWIRIQTERFQKLDSNTPVPKRVKIDKPELSDPVIILEIENAIKYNQNVVQDYKKGKTASLNFLVGRVMKNITKPIPK